MTTARRSLVSQTFVRLASDGNGLYLEAPDVSPAIEGLLRLAGWQGHPLLPEGLTLGPARWPTLRQVGLPHLGRGWRRRPMADLWIAHAVAMERWRAGLFAPGAPNLLDLKAELARRESSPCCLCARLCGARRRSGERGACGATVTPRLFSLEVLSAEEPGLGRGAAPRLAGCNADCLFCSRPDGIRAQAGQPATVPAIRRWIEAQATAVDAIHWIGGNVDQELPTVLAVMRQLDAELPVIWNHNATATELAIALLDGVADVFIPDLRFGPGDCAARLGAPVMSFDNCTAAIAAELRQAATTVVRVLGLPGHVECCARPCLEWLAERRDRVFVSLLDHSYQPLRRARGHPTLGRPLNAQERATLDDLVRNLGLRRVS